MKRFIASILISIFLLTPFAYAYEDVPASSQYFYAIEYLRRNDVFKNTRLFRPDILISKAEFIKYLVLLNSPDFQKRSTVKLPFEDTRDNAWYASYFDEAIQLGILDEREPRVDPYKKLTVFEALELLFHSRSIPIPKRYKGTVPYQDVDRNERVKPLIMRAIDLEIVTPERFDHFGIYRRVNRAQAAHMIYRMDLVDLGAAPTQAQPVISDPSLQKIMSIWELITSNFLERSRLDLMEMSDAAIKTIVEELDDPYSAYLDQKENEAFADELGGEIEGIGAYIDIDDNGRITIVAPITDSPAFHAGIKAGDIIKKIDGVSTEGMSIFEAVSRIKGPKGTTVKLTVQRNSQILTISIVRDVITIHAMEYELIENDTIVHVKLFQFNQNTSREFFEIVEVIEANPGIKGMILDMRNNPGGLLDSSVNLTSYLLPRETEVVNIQYNFFSFKQYARGRSQLKDFPLVVLVNKGSASASEIVAGALQDHGRAKIIGEITFGKGTVQEVNYFRDNSSLKLTVAKWLTPNGHNIEGNGIKPDITVINPKDSTTDNQLNRAITELKKIF